MLLALAVARSGLACRSAVEACAAAQQPAEMPGRGQREKTHCACARCPFGDSEGTQYSCIERRGRRVYLGSKCIRVRDSDSELGTYYPWLLSFEVSLGSRQVRWRAASTHQLPPTRSGSRVIRSRSAASCGRRDPTTLNTTSSEPRDYTENRQKRMPKGDGGWGRNRVHARGGSEARN